MKDYPRGSVHDLGRGIFAYIQPPGTWGLNNSGFIIASHGTLIIDATLTELRTRSLIQEVDARSNGPARTLLNTHHHGDHAYGNPLFPSATILSHPACRHELLRDEMVSTRRFPEVDYGAVGIHPPFLTFEGPLVYWADDLRVEIRPISEPAHSRGDAYCWVPEESILFTGDLAFNGCTPLALTGSVQGILRALEELLALQPERVVPGHGGITDASVLRSAQAYFEWLWELALDAHRRGRSPLEAADTAVPEAFAGWLEPERTVANLHRALAEIDPSRTVSSTDAYADMVTFNGGIPLTCRA